MREVSRSAGRSYYLRSYRGFEHALDGLFRERGLFLHERDIIFFQAPVAGGVRQNGKKKAEPLKVQPYEGCYNLLS